MCEKQVKIKEHHLKVKKKSESKNLQSLKLYKYKGNQSYKNTSFP